MWDLTPMSIFINYSLCELFISSQYGTGVLQLEYTKNILYLQYIVTHTIDIVITF
jgi:hypothetical protein